MKTVGQRREPELSRQASGSLLAEGARFSESIAWLAPSTFVPKGVYRYASHEEANRHALECLARGMARQAMERG
ncbi:hypothetical protein GCM10027399_12050 [Curvibacter fontanus]